MSTFIQLTDYKSSDEKEEGFFKAENRYVAKQEDFKKIPGCPVAYWAKQIIKDLFDNKNINDFYITREGLATADNELFVRQWHEVFLENIDFNCRDTNKTFLKWFPYVKGGSFRKWSGNNELIVNWQNDGESIKNNIDETTGRIRSHNYNSEYSFKEGFSWSGLSNSGFSVRYIKEGCLFDAKGPMGFSKDNLSLKYIMGFLNGNVTTYLLKILSPTMDYKLGHILNLPLIEIQSKIIKNKIEILAEQNIDISKEEWDSRETSWDFTCNALLKHNLDGSLEKAYEGYCAYWAEKFNTLHANEEELNRLFIEIYELQDELTPDVALGDITILKNEATIEDGKLVFRADEIIKQFISYGVGVMFGRYSLDHEGLHVANMHQSLEDTNVSFDIATPSFEADEDNIIPVLEDDYFKDDITARFIQFVKVTFDEASLHGNIRFIENALGMSLRKYFVKGFYEDHIKRYKKRTIYWMVS